jgi:hypothetical protein
LKNTSAGGNAGLFFFGSLLGKRWCVISGRALSDTGHGNSIGVAVTPTVEVAYVILAGFLHGLARRLGRDCVGQGSSRAPG